MSALERWKKRVETHHAQSIGARDRCAATEDFWRPYASHFRADSRRTGDPEVDCLGRQVRSEQTLIDVGGGAVRLALPLALRCRRVTVVEPSESMQSEPREGVLEAGIDNLTILDSNWENAELDPADVVLCAHVMYGVVDVDCFIRKFEAHAREQVLMLMFMEYPQSGLSPLWKVVHGEERVELPALPELLEVLWEMEVYPNVEMVEARGPQVFESHDAAVEQLRRRLYVNPDTQQDRRLQVAARELLVEEPDGVSVRGARPRRLGVISWQPG